MGNLINKNVLILVLVLVGILILLLVLTTYSNPSLPPPVTTPTSTPLPTFSALPIPPAGTGKGFESQEYKEAEEDFIKQYPLLQKLPAKSDYFSIEYIDEQHLIVHSKTEDKNRDYESAKDWFTIKEIDLTKVAVEYR